MPKSLQQIVKLGSQYRNTQKILAFMHFQSEFRNEVSKTTANPDYQHCTRLFNQADPGESQQSLPKPLPSSPHPVVWLPVPPTQDLVRETLEAMKCILPTGGQLEVAVLHAAWMHGCVDAAKEICRAGERELGTFTWKHYPAPDYRGCEAPVVILLGYGFWMEHISRARNQLVMVTTGEKMELTEDFYSKYEHRRSKLSFTADEVSEKLSFTAGAEDKGDIRHVLQMSADQGRLQKMGDKRIFLPEFPFLELENFSEGRE